MYENNKQLSIYNRDRITIIVIVIVRLSPSSQDRHSIPIFIFLTFVLHFVYPNKLTIDCDGQHKHGE